MKKSLAFCSKCNKPFPFKNNGSNAATSKTLPSELICDDCRAKIQKESAETLQTTKQ